MSPGSTAVAHRSLPEPLGTLLVTARPRFWLYLAGPALVGLVFGASALAELASATAVAVVAYFLVPANVFLYGVNDVFDAAADRLNPRKAVRERRFGGEPVVVAGVVVGAGAGAGLAVTLGGLAGAAVLGFLLLGAAYSVPPVRLKTRPPLDSMSNGLYILPGVAGYEALAGAAPPTLAVLGGWLWAMGMHTFSAIPDIAADRRAGVETLATLLGRRRATGYVGACWLLAAATFGAIDGRLGVLLLGYPSLLVLLHQSPVAVKRSYWWFPAVNTGVGTVITMAGLWLTVHG